MLIRLDEVIAVYSEDEPNTVTVALSARMDRGAKDESFGTSKVHPVMRDRYGRWEPGGGWARLRQSTVGRPDCPWVQREFGRPSALTPRVLCPG
jgi:hypothetical protein